jgi:HPt (histidine-containing phosphotransfer) domain-containing protein
MITIDSLQEYGADVKSGLARCANNEGLYLRLVKIIVTELSTDALGEALRADDYSKAFEVAHKLKGGVGNLGLTPVADPLCEITELLRDRKPIDCQAAYGEIVTETKKLAALLD